MLLAFLLLAIVTVTVTAKEVPCKVGQQQCKGSLNLNVVDNEHYCCDDGFSVKLTSRRVNAKPSTTCTCSKNNEFDCLEGYANCQNKNNYASDGFTIKCCENGYNMEYVSNSFVNGVRVDYCKCLRYGSFGRPMTNEEQAQFSQAMNNFSQNLRTQLDQMHQTIAHNIAQVKNHLNNGFMGGLLNGLTQSLNRVANQQALRFGNIITANSARNMAQPIKSTPAMPSRTWDLRQRRFQELQRRLQQRQQNEIGLTFWDRLTRNTVLGQMMTPSWWFGRNWGGLFGYFNQTA